jgi:ADP-ribose pyrophosphatase
MVWKKLSTKTVYKNRFMTVTEDELVTDHGDPVTFGVVHKEPAVMIIPWEGVKVTLVGQYRYPVDLFSWEFPAGHMEHASIEAAAKTELEEETGYKAERLIKLGEFAIATGHNTQICHTYLATGLTSGTQNLEPAEKGMQLKAVSLDELNQMVVRGEIIDGLTISSLKLFELYLAKQQSHE